MIKSLASEQETLAYRRLLQLFQQTPIPPKEILANFGLYLCRSALSKILFLDDLYAKILNVHGIIVEFGTRWGQNVVLFSTLRNVYEPHNYSRKIVGFDTFSGFPGVSPRDGDCASPGMLSVTEGYEAYLKELLRVHEELAPRSNLTKFEIVKGDVAVTVPDYLCKHPETIVALAYFDLDLYDPTKKCLEVITPHLAKGSIIGFDELCLADFPGETVALREVLGLQRLRRSQFSMYQSYIVVE